MQIVDYLSDYDINAAHHFLDALESLEKQLSVFPFSVPVSTHRSLMLRGYRVATLSDYLVFCKVENTTVIVMNIIHEKRDYIKVLLTNN